LISLLWRDPGEFIDALDKAWSRLGMNGNFDIDPCICADDVWPGFSPTVRDVKKKRKRKKKRGLLSRKNFKLHKATNSWILVGDHLPPAVPPRASTLQGRRRKMNH
jgi:hypothetical protein